jgi:hypothetical protein
MEIEITPTPTPTPLPVRPLWEDTLDEIKRQQDNSTE